MLLHADPIHLGFNVGLQLLVGESFYKYQTLENSTNVNSGWALDRCCRIFFREGLGVGVKYFENYC